MQLRLLRWKTRAWAALAFALLSAARGGGENVAPELTIDEPVYDFGTVEQGTSIEHVFVLHNRGHSELRLEHVKGSCGCTVAVASANVIDAGGEGRISVRLDTGRLTGHTTKVVTAYTNDPNAPAIGLTLTGDVAVDLAVTPNPLYLGKVRRGEPARHELRVTAGRPSATYEVTAVEHSNPALHTSLEPLGATPGQQQIVVELDRDMPLGRFNDQLVLHTTSPRTPVLTVPVFGSIEGDVVVLPPQVTFGLARRGVGEERDLYIRNRGAQPVTVTGVSVPKGVVTYRLSTVEEGLEYRLTLRLRDDLPTGKVEGKIEIFTDHPDEGRLVVPLYAIVRDGSRHG